MPFDLQTRLLRVLSDGNFYRVGGHSAVKTNVRVIAATHQDLEQRVREGAFREDLFHRLNVIRLRLPALRERLEDIPMLTRHFLAVSAIQLGIEPKRITDLALSRLAMFGFPGNVRQLENICHWLTVMAPAQVIEAKDLPPEVLAASQAVMGVTAVHSQFGALPGTLPSTLLAPEGSAAASGVPLIYDAVSATRAGSDEDIPAYLPEVTTGHWEEALEFETMDLLSKGSADVWDVLTQRFESRMIRAALLVTKGRRIEAAHKLGIGRNTITRKIQELGLE